MNNVTRKLIPWLFALIWLPAIVQADFQEGKHYQRLKTPVPTSSGDKIEVVELFWYGCPHCYRLEPKIDKWVENKLEHVEFVRIPADLGRPIGKLHARAYYTAETLGAMDKIHQPLLNAIHVEKRRIGTEDQLAKFFAEQGVDEETFRKAFNSFQVETMVRRSQQLVRRYRANSVPTLVVNGEYLTNGTMAGSQDKVFEVLNYLIGKEGKAG